VNGTSVMLKIGNGHVIPARQLEVLGEYMGSEKRRLFGGQSAASSILG
jgi:hypothetical protein